MKRERLRIENIRKGSLLKRIELQVFEGEIIHCVFDNLQEKTLFLNIMTGKQKADYGRVYYEENGIPEKDTARVLKMRVALISRESRLIDSVSMEENMFLVRPQVKGHWVKRRNYRKEAAELFEEFGLEIDMEKPMARRSVFEKVQIEIMKAYLLGQKIIILTALSICLSDAEMRKLWQLLEKLRGRGLSCLVVEPLEDINFIYTDTVVVIKHGRTCAVKDVDDCDYTTLHTILYRDEMEKNAEDWKRGTKEMSGEGISVQDICTAYLRHVSFSVDRGEIVKLFCIDERSYDEVTGFLKGESEAVSGRLRIGSAQKAVGKVLGGVKDRIGVVQGNPGTASLFEELSAMDNLQILLSQKVSGMWMIPKYKKSIRKLLGGIISDDVYARKVKDLSPADVQRIVYCRWLIYSPQLLVCIQPFAEGDIQARETAREMIYMLEKRNIPVLIITSNTAELNYCRGRELYMRHGRMISKEEAYEFLYSEL